MDPTATLKRIQETLSEYHRTLDLEHLDDAHNSAQDLAQWLDRGGFEPEGLERFPQAWALTQMQRSS